MMVVIVLPVYNEEKILKNNVEQIFDFCKNNLNDDWQILIVDNLSTDKTGAIVKELAQANQLIKYLYINKKGKGAAIKAGWESIDADIYVFMDVDLATDLSALPHLISEIKNGYDLVVGSRYQNGSLVKRSLFRRIFSFGYKKILGLIVNIKIKDAPCGFKAINSKIKASILPQIKNQEWFFDSELVILADKAGYKIKEIPVIWQDRREGKDKSRVNPFAVGWDYLKEVIKIRIRLGRS